MWRRDIVARAAVAVVRRRNVTVFAAVAHFALSNAIEDVAIVVSNGETAPLAVTAAQRFHAFVRLANVRVHEVRSGG